MRKHITLKDGSAYSVDYCCTIDGGKTYCYVETKWSSAEHHLTVHYRPERTWDDHMGNTECGYYCVVPFPNGEKHRVYMF